MAVEKLTFEMNAVGNAVPEMKKVQTQLGNVNRTMTQATASMTKHANTNRALSGASRNMTRNLGMASLQFQDMAVQASMGTDALRIMTMQAPQLASVFGPKGMIVGALIAVGGAIAMLGDKTTKLTFDFKKFGADMRVAFAPFIDFIRPAVDLVTRGFELFKQGAMIAINGVINGTAALYTVYANLPAIVREAFTRAGKQIELFGLNVGMITNDIQFRFMEMFAAITSDFTSFINDTTRQINEAFNLNLPTDIGSEMMDSLAQSMGASNDQFEVMLSKSNKLRDELDKPYQSVTDLKNDLNNITQIDLFSYFDRVKRKSDETANEMAKITTVADMIGDNFETAFMSVIRGTKNAGDAFRSMAANIIAELYRVFVIKKITGFITGAIETAFPSVGAIPMRAIGGAVQRGNPYIVGERGPELFVPSRTGSIVSNDKMGGGGGVVVQQTINVTTGVQQTVRNEIQTLLPQIAEASKAAVLDARRRGGSFANAF